jgi:hypothetical protein
MGDLQRRRRPTAAQHRADAFYRPGSHRAHQWRAIQKIGRWPYSCVQPAGTCDSGSGSLEWFRRNGSRPHWPLPAASAQEANRGPGPSWTDHQRSGKAVWRGVLVRRPDAVLQRCEGLPPRVRRLRADCEPDRAPNPSTGMPGRLRGADLSGSNREALPGPPSAAGSFRSTISRTRQPGNGEL